MQCFNASGADITRYRQPGDQRYSPAHNFNPIEGISLDSDDPHMPGGPIINFTLADGSVIHMTDLPEPSQPGKSRKHHKGSNSSKPAGGDEPWPYPDAWAQHFKEGNTHQRDWLEFPLPPPPGTLPPPPPPLPDSERLGPVDAGSAAAASSPGAAMSLGYSVHTTRTGGQIFNFDTLCLLHYRTDGVDEDVGDGFKRPQNATDLHRRSLSHELETKHEVFVDQSRTPGILSHSEKYDSSSGSSQTSGATSNMPFSTTSSSWRRRLALLVMATTAMTCMP